MCYQQIDIDKQNSFSKANELPDNAVHSYKLLKYENYKMRLVNQKHIAMWVLPNDGEKSPSKLNTKESIELRLDQC